MNYDAPLRPAADVYRYIAFVRRDGSVHSVMRFSDASEFAMQELRRDAELCHMRLKPLTHAEWNNAKAFDLCPRFEYHEGLDGGYVSVP